MESRGVESKEAILVGVRVRRRIPCDQGKPNYWTVGPKRIWSPECLKVYTFDSVLDSSARNKDVFEALCQHIVRSTFLGFNGTIFAYGQTSSGKTHTMMGDEDEPGILPASIDAIFDLIDETPSREFLLRVSYFEIYNENVVDLISESQKRSLQLREDSKGNIIVDGATEKIVKHPSEVMNWIVLGEKNRHVGATDMNERSSRSHTIFRLIIESSVKPDDEEHTDGAITVSQLNLVDLAGSERVSQAKTTGKSLREGGNINKSLFVLSQVINKLSKGSTEFVPFRESKLTRILRNSLDGNARTAVICTVTPTELESTKSTLEFASRAQRIVQSAQVNAVLDDKALMCKLKKEMARLRQELEYERNEGKAFLEERLNSALLKKTQEIQELELERENLRTAMKDKEKQLEGLTERIISREARPIQTKQGENGRETWPFALSKRSNRRVSFFPKLLTNMERHATSSNKVSPDHPSQHNAFVSDRRQRKNKSSQTEYSELQAFNQLESNLMTSEQSRQQLQSPNNSQEDRDNLLLASNKELTEVRLRIKDLEENTIKALQDDNRGKANSLMKKESEVSQLQSRLSDSLKDAKEKDKIISSLESKVKALTEQIECEGSQTRLRQRLEVELQEEEMKATNEVGGDHLRGSEKLSQQGYNLKRKSSERAPLMYPFQPKRSNTDEREEDLEEKMEQLQDALREKESLLKETQSKLRNQEEVKSKEKSTSAQLLRRLEKQGSQLTLEARKAKKEYERIRKELSKASSDQEDRLLVYSLQESSVKMFYIHKELKSRDEEIEELKRNLELMLERSNAHQGELTCILQDDGLKGTHNALNEPKRIGKAISFRRNGSPTSDTGLLPKDNEGPGPSSRATYSKGGSRRPRTAVYAYLP